MEVTRTITIKDKDFGALFEDMNSFLGNDFTGVDSKSAEGVEFVKKFPALSKLHHLLETELMKEQSTYNYERITG